MPVLIEPDRLVFYNQEDSVRASEEPAARLDIQEPANRPGESGRRTGQVYKKWEWVKSNDKRLIRTETCIGTGKKRPLPSFAEPRVWMPIGPDGKPVEPVGDQTVGVRYSKHETEPVYVFRHDRKYADDVKWCICPAIRASTQESFSELLRRAGMTDRWTYNCFLMPKAQRHPPISTEDYLVYVCSDEHAEELEKLKAEYENLYVVKLVKASPEEAHRESQVYTREGRPTIDMWARIRGSTTRLLCHYTEANEQALERIWWFMTEPESA